jgi:hypothetical protein
MYGYNPVDKSAYSGPCDRLWQCDQWSKITAKAKLPTKLGGKFMLH